MKYQIKFYVKIEGKTEVVVVKANASTAYLAVARATLKYKKMFPAGNETFETVEVMTDAEARFWQGSSLKKNWFSTRFENASIADIVE